MQALPIERSALCAFFTAAALVACGGNVVSSTASDGGATSSAIDDGGPRTSVTPPKPVATTSPSTTPPTLRVPKSHRPVAVRCDSVRPSIDPNVPDSGAGNCNEHADCTAGVNGRCDGNSHDGWNCTYDECTTDDDCGAGAGICSCEGAFRADANRCLSTNGCRVDSDCGGGAGFCSPTLGGCGHFDKTVGYFCHTPQDECVDDADCGGPGAPGSYCAYDKTVARWKCSSAECAG